MIRNGRAVEQRCERRAVRSVAPKAAGPTSKPEGTLAEKCEWMRRRQAARRRSGKRA